MNYLEMKKSYIKGWNTYNNKSILSHVYMPYGFSVSLGLKEYTEGKHLANALIGRFEEGAENIRPSYHAYDDSYTECHLTYKNTKLHIQTATIGEDIVMLVKPCVSDVKLPLLTVDVNILWNKAGYVNLEDNIVMGRLGDKTISVYHTGKEVYEPHVQCSGKYYCLELSGDVGVSTGIFRTVEEITTIIQNGREFFIKYCEKFSSDAETYKAMQSCVAWDTIYEPLKDRVVTPVSRLWSEGAGGYTLFCWDTYFAALMASADNKELAYSNAIEITKEKTEENFVPNFVHATGFKSRDRSQPPIGSYVINEIYKKYKEKWFLEEVFLDLYNWNLWWRENRQIKTGLFTWGSSKYAPVVDGYWESHHVNNTEGAALESGLDNSPMYDNLEFNAARNMLELIDVGLTSMVLLDTYSLIEIATVLGETEKVKDLVEFSKTIESNMLSLWNEEFGLFLNFNTAKNEFSYEISPTNFYALYNKNIPKENVKRIIDEHFYNKEEFYGEYIMPSIARNDAAYGEQTYWRGRIWAPMNLLVYIGLKNYDVAENAAEDLSEKSKNLILKEWLEYGHVHENYNSDTGCGCDVTSSDKFYHWGGLLGYIYLKQKGMI